VTDRSKDPNVTRSGRMPKPKAPDEPLLSETQRLLRQVFSSDHHDIKYQYRTLPEAMAYFVELYAGSLDRYLAAKTERERLAARLLLEMKSDLEVRRSEKVIDAEILTNVDFISAKREEIAAEVEYKRAQKMFVVLETKRDMLVSLGAHVRVEMGADNALSAFGGGTPRDLESQVDRMFGSTSPSLEEISNDPDI
jgi:hypothetical protein